MQKIGGRRRGSHDDRNALSRFCHDARHAGWATATTYAKLKAPRQSRWPSALTKISKQKKRETLRGLQNVAGPRTTPPPRRYRLPAGTAATSVIPLPQ